MASLWTASGRRLAEVEVARTLRARSRGLLGRDGIAGALLIVPATSVHTFGMRFAIDVGFLDKSGRVIATTSMRRNRLGLPRFRAHCVLEAERGAFASWGLTKGDVVSVSDGDEPSAEAAGR